MVRRSNVFISNNESCAGVRYRLVGQCEPPTHLYTCRVARSKLRWRSREHPTPNFGPRPTTSEQIFQGLWPWPLHAQAPYFLPSTLTLLRKDPLYTALCIMWVGPPWWLLEKSCNSIKGRAMNLSPLSMYMSPSKWSEFHCCHENGKKDFHNDVWHILEISKKCTT